uniref:Lysine ketoglutarate reductase trans-splicing related 1 n=1 Tax=Kalanchoe fedtschenkoi TaxID=63787 RepID=A0A7N0VMT9_KALFE
MPMKPLKPCQLRKALAPFDGESLPSKMRRQLPFTGLVCLVMLFIIYRTTNYQYHQTEFEKMHPFETEEDFMADSKKLNGLPRGIVQPRSDLELKPLWASSRIKDDVATNRHLLAIPVGINQKTNVDAIVQKFLPENFTVILFHYDGNVDGWFDLDWSNNVVHIVAQNQTKWWFAKRFLHPDVVAIYDYVFLWDEDVAVDHFDPRRYLSIVKSEGLEISQPALGINSTNIHHKITMRKKTKRMHRRVYDLRGSVKCSRTSVGPPCNGFVEGMAPVFSRSAWFCAWHLIQNDLVHGWGMDMKLGYCAQGDRTKKVGIIDSEFIVHKGIQTLGGPSVKKPPPDLSSSLRKAQRRSAFDTRSEVRRQSTAELQIFKARWDQAVKGDKNWVDPSLRPPSKKKAQQLPRPRPAS